MPDPAAVGGGAARPHGTVLIATKLHPPPPRPELVTRSPLVELLRANGDAKVTLVGAPAGWGKTTLLGEWCAAPEEPRPFAWLALDAGDNDPVRFWAYLVEALRTVDAGIGAHLPRALPALRTTMVGAVLPRLINDLAARDGQIVLVLDDYHLIANPEIHNGLAFLVEHLPPTLHLALASRADPPLPLARLRARGQLAELRAADLRFNRQEAAALLNDRLGLGLRAQDVARLQDRTEGWAAGLCLAALSLRGRSDPAAFIAPLAGDDRPQVDKLGSEVLDGLPDQMRTFLLRTSILDRLCGPLCDAVTATVGSARRLEQIERSNLFLVALDSRRFWYRYHHLFGELLRHQLDQAEPRLVATLHRRAAAWYRDESLIPEAIAHTTAAGDTAEAAELIALHWNATFNAGALATVTRWLDRLPPDAVAADARLCLARAWVAMDLGRLGEVERWIEAAEVGGLPGPIHDGAPSVQAATTMLRALHEFKVGAVGQATRTARVALALVPDQTFWRTAASCVLGATLHWHGATADAAAVLADAARLAEQTGNALAGIYALGYLAMIAAEHGELDEATRRADAAGRLGDDPNRAEHFVSMLAHLARGTVLQQRGRLAEGEVELRRGVELSRRGAGRVELAYGLVALAEARHAAGARDQALALVRDAGRVLDACPDPGGVVTERAARAARRLRTTPTGSALPAGGARAGSPTPTVSDRELAVLRLLPGELSLREIGAALYVSLNTVKTHTRSIYAKLGASARAEAVARARELGLL